MGAPYTLDLRERVVAAFRSGMSKLETATVFQVSESSVQRWSRLDREKGSVAARAMGGQRPFALASATGLSNGSRNSRIRRSAHYWLNCVAVTSGSATSPYGTSSTAPTQL